MSEVEVILNTWSNTDIPPNPSKNAQIIIFIDMALIGIWEIIETPFVSSTIPESNPIAKEDGIWTRESMGAMIADRIFKIPVLLSIDIITLKSTTNPPIITTVLIDDIMLFWKILPKLESFGGNFLSLSI